MLTIKIIKVIMLSITEAEYIATAEASKEILLMKRFMQELGHKQDEYIMHCDSQSIIHLSKNSTFHTRMKHIDIRYHWIREMLEDHLRVSASCLTL